MRTAIACPEPDPEGRFSDAVKYPAGTILKMLDSGRARMKGPSEKEIVYVLNRLTRLDHGMTPGQCRCCLLSCLAFVDISELHEGNLRLKTEYVLRATQAPSPEIELALEQFLPTHMDAFCWRGVDLAITLWDSLTPEQQESVRRLTDFNIGLYFVVTSWESNTAGFLRQIQGTIADLRAAGARLSADQEDVLQTWLFASDLMIPMLFH